MDIFGQGGVPLPGPLTEQEKQDVINQKLQAEAARKSYWLQAAASAPPDQRAAINAQIAGPRILPTPPAPPSTPTVPGAAAGPWGKVEPSFGPAEPPPMPGVSSYGPAATSFEEPPAPIRAEMVNGKLVFTNQALGGTDVGYDAGVDQWQGRALLDQETRARDQAAQATKATAGGNEDSPWGPRSSYSGPAIRTPEDERFRDFTIQKTPDRAPGPVRADQTGFRGSYIPSAPVPDVAGLDQKGFEQQMAEMTKSASPGAQDEFKQRYLEQEGIRQEIAKRSLMEGQAAQAQGQGAAGQAAAGFDVARTGIVNDPVANAIKQGTATAEQMKAFQGRLMEEATAQVEAELAQQPGKAAMMSETILKMGLAKTPDEALIVAKQRLAQTRFNQIIDQDPEMKKALARAGMYMGAGAGTAIGGA